jgi:hypothetical protein
MFPDPLAVQGYVEGLISVPWGIMRAWYDLRSTAILPPADQALSHPAGMMEQTSSSLRPSACSLTMRAFLPGILEWDAKPLWLFSSINTSQD